MILYRKQKYPCLEAFLESGHVDYKSKKAAPFIAI